MNANRRPFLACTVTGLLAALGAGTGVAPNGHPVCLTIFLSRDCPHCEAVDRQNLARLAKRLGCEIRPRYLSTEDRDNYGLLVSMEQRFGDEGNDVPVVFVGSHVLGGAKEVEAKLVGLVRKYAASGGAESHAGLSAPRHTSAPAQTRVEKPIYVAYFDSPGCEHCRRVRFMLRKLQADFPTLHLREYDTSKRTNVLLQEAMGEKLGVPPKRRLLTPAVIVGNRTFVQRQVTDRSLRQHISAVLRTGTPRPWAADYDLAAAEQRLRHKLDTASLGTVVVGGLLDGINPCAFATLILFISYMRAAGRDRAKLLAISASFIVAVFLVYTAVGFGLWHAVAWADDLPWLGAALTWCIAGLCAVLAALSVADGIKAMRGRHREILLQLPRGLKRRIQSVLIRFGRTHYLVLGGLLIGGLISVLELACTGQIYLPVIRVVAMSVGQANPEAILLLVTYNLCFVAPLIAIFALAYWGTSSERLAEALRKHMAATKLATAVFFAGLAVLMLATEYHW